MRLTDEMIQEDDKRFKRQDLLAEFNYYGKEVPKRKSITNDDIRFYAWLCRSAYSLLKEQETKTGQWIEQDDGYDDVYYDCSACGLSWVMIEGTPQENGMLYCPHCGAKMEGV